MERRSFRKRPVSSCFDTALRLLSRRDHTTIELKRKLTLRGYEEAEISDAISRTQSYIRDDERLRSRMRMLVQKGAGEKRLVAEASILGVPLTREKLAEFLATENLSFADALDRLIEKKIGNEPQNLTRKEYERLIRFLVSKGHSPSVVQRKLTQKQIRMEK